MNGGARDWAGVIGVFVGIAVVVALGLGIGDRVRSNSYVFVDNASDVPAVVKLDGEESLTVAPKTVGVVYTRHGDHQIRVERVGQAVFEKQVTLESPGFFQVKKYILNPQGESGYWVRTLTYGTGFAMPPPNLTGLDDAYISIARMITLLDTTEWFLVPADMSDYVLNEVPPESIELPKGQSSTTKKQICRMARSEYELIKSAPSRQNVTEEEVKALATVVDRVRNIAEQAGP